MVPPQTAVMGEDRCFDALLASLTLAAPRLRKEEIVALQTALAEACRLHDPSQADEMEKLLAKMRLSSRPDEEQEEEEEAPPPPPPEPMSVGGFVAPSGHFELGVAPSKVSSSHHRHRRVARRLEPSLQNAAAPEEPRPPPKFELGPPPPPRKTKASPRPPPPAMAKQRLQFSGSRAAKENVEPRSAWEVAYDEGKRLYEAGDYTKAAAEFSASLGAAPEKWASRARALANRGACLAALGDVVGAGRDCSEATRCDPTLYKAQNRLGRLALAAGDLEACRAAFKAASLFAGKDNEAVAASAAGLADLRSLEVAMERAEAALARADEVADDDGSLRAACRAELERAARHADHALGLAPRSSRAVLAKARALAKLKRWPDVEQACDAFAAELHREHRNTAAALAFTNFDLALVYVRCLRTREAPDVRRSRADEALAAVADCAALDESIRQACRTRLEVAAKLKRAKDRADSAYSRGHFRAAVAMYRDALCLAADQDHDGLRAALHCNLAAAALVLGRHADADDHCTKALELRPDYLRARLRRARARARAEKYAASLADFDAYLAAAAKAKPADRPAGSDAPDRVAAERRRVDLDLRRRDRRQRCGPDDDEQPSGVPRKSSPSTHYTVLGIAATARPVDVKKAYAKLALRYHPDRNDDPNATSAMARINEAYECLKDAALRAECVPNHTRPN